MPIAAFWAVGTGVVLRVAVRAGFGFPILILASLAGGCSSSADFVQSWTKNHGGIVIGPDLDRVHAAAKPVVESVSGRRITISVLNSDQLTAYAWPDGHVYISRGLVQHLSDAELAAVVAHEIGHMLADGHVHAGGNVHADEIAAVSGSGKQCSGTESEIAADLAGIDLLEQSDLPPHAMLSMLEKLTTHHARSKASRNSFERRIAAVQARLDLNGASGSPIP